jgi:hypothetical protein
MTYSLSDIIQPSRRMSLTSNSTHIYAIHRLSVRMDSLLLICGLCLLMCAMSSCINPFAPRLGTQDSTANVLGDQNTVEGVFQNFRYAYLFKDTLTYGRLLDNDFTFIYRNYERNIDVAWSRTEDMLTTAGLFRTSQNLDLVWNEIITTSGDSVMSDVSRGFNLTITFNPNDVVRVTGRVNLRLVRPTPTAVWKIRQWRDESNF